MTTTERNAITTPATGLQVYNTTTNAINFYNGSSWTAPAATGGSNRQIQFNNSGSLGGSSSLVWTASGDLEIYGGVYHSQPGGAYFTLARGDATTQADDTLGALQFGSSDNGSMYEGLTAIASEDHTTTASGMHLLFKTIPNTTEVAQERMRISQAGYVGIGTTDPAEKLHLQGSDEEVRLRIMNVNSTTPRYPGVFVANVMGSGNHNGAPSFTGLQTRGTAGVTAPVQNGEDRKNNEGFHAVCRLWPSSLVPSISTLSL